MCVKFLRVSTDLNETLPLDGYEPPPRAPRPGQAYTDSSGGFWQVKQLTVTNNPAGFYLVHLSHGSSLDTLSDSMVIGPRAFAALVHDRDLRPHLHSV